MARVVLLDRTLDRRELGYRLVAFLREVATYPLQPRQASLYLGKTALELCGAIRKVIPLGLYLGKTVTKGGILTNELRSRSYLV